MSRASISYKLVFCSMADQRQFSRFFTMIVICS